MCQPTHSLLFTLGSIPFVVLLSLQYSGKIIGRRIERPEKTHAPNLAIMPINNGMDAHEARPIAIGLIEVRQELAVGIGAPGADEDGAHVLAPSMRMISPLLLLCWYRCR